jgi:hypothetical protein
MDQENIPTGFPEPPAEDEPGNLSKDPEPHHTLNKPVDEPEEHGDAPHPDQDIEAEPTEAPERDRLDD